MLTLTGCRPGVCAVVAVLVAAGAVLGAARIEAIDHSELRSLAGHEVTLRGYVTKHERTSFGVRRMRVRVKALLDGGSPRRLDELAQLRVPRGLPLARPSIGEELIASGGLEASQRQPGRSFDYSAYLRRAGVHTILRARSVRLTGERRRGLAGAIDGLRERAEAGVAAGLGSPLGALARGMVLGQDEEIPDRMSEDFKRSGLAHVLAVSGQNVALLAVLAWPLLGAMGIGRRVRLIAVLGLIGLYVPVTGAGPSILRAGVMGAAGTVAALAGRPASRWHALLLAAAVTLALDPRAWQDLGWQLSFAAVVGIFCLLSPLSHLLAGIPEPLRTGTALTAAATLATAPLMSFHFGRVSLVSLLANLVALPAIAPVMWIGMLDSAVAQIWLPPAAVMNALNVFLLGYVATVAHWSAYAPGAVLDARIGSPGGLAAAYACLAALLVSVRRAAGSGPERPGASRLGPLMLAGALAASVLLAAWLFRPTPASPPACFTATFLDVGQGDATLFQAPGGPTVLVDGGPPEAGVLGKLRDHGVHGLDAVVLTHSQRDHEGGLERVLRELPVRLLIDGGRGSGGALHDRIVAAARARGTRVVAGTAGEVFRRRGLRMRVLSPAPQDRSAPGDDPNLGAIVLLVSYRGLDFFMPADAESEVTAALRLRRVEVLKVAHHGSADEGLRALLERLRPDAAVIEVGHNPYGHPDPRTLASLTARVPRVFRTDRDGEVRVTLGPLGPGIAAGH